MASWHHSHKKPLLEDNQESHAPPFGEHVSHRPSLRRAKSPPKSPHRKSGLFIPYPSLREGRTPSTLPWGRQVSARTQRYVFHSVTGQFDAGSSGCEVLSVEAELEHQETTRWQTTGIVLAYFAFGQLVGRLKDWTPIDSFYCTVVTFTTVGYGDFSFNSESKGSDQILGSIFIATGVVIFGYALAQQFSFSVQWEEDNVKLQAHERERGNARVKLSGWVHSLRRAIRERVAPASTERAGLATSIEEEARGRLRVNLLIALMQAAFIVLFGATSLGVYEGWRWQTSVYWAVTTASTVGYGDVVPTTECGRFIAAWIILFSVSVWTRTVGVVTGYAKLMKEVEARNAVLNQFGTTLTGEEFDTLSHGEEMRELGLSAREDSVTRDEFCIYMLLKLGRVSREELRGCQEAFDMLDLSHSGELVKEDLIAHASKRREQWGSVPDDVDFMHKPKLCSNCGNQVGKAERFCRKCGKPRDHTSDAGDTPMGSSSPA